MPLGLLVASFLKSATKRRNNETSNINSTCITLYENRQMFGVTTGIRMVQSNNFGATNLRVDGGLLNFRKYLDADIVFTVQ